MLKTIGVVALLGLWLVSGVVDVRDVQVSSEAPAFATEEKKPKKGGKKGGEEEEEELRAPVALRAA